MDAKFLRDLILATCCDHGLNREEQFVYFDLLLEPENLELVKKLNEYPNAVYAYESLRIRIDVLEEMERN